MFILGDFKSHTQTKNNFVENYNLYKSVINLVDFVPISRTQNYRGAGRSSEVERSLMVRWVVESILHGVNPLSYLSFRPVLHDWCNKGRGMCYPVCGMVHIK